MMNFMKKCLGYKELKGECSNALRSVISLNLVQADIEEGRDT